MASYPQFTFYYDYDVDERTHPCPPKVPTHGPPLFFDAIMSRPCANPLFLRWLGTSFSTCVALTLANHLHYHLHSPHSLVCTSSSILRPLISAQSFIVTARAHAYLHPSMLVRSFAHTCD